MFALPAYLCTILLDSVLMLLFTHAGVKIVLPETRSIPSWDTLTQLSSNIVLVWILYYSACLCEDKSENYAWYSWTILSLSELLGKLNLQWASLSLLQLVSAISGWALLAAVVFLSCSIAAKIIFHTVTKPRMAELQRFQLTGRDDLPAESVHLYWQSVNQDRGYFRQRNQLSQSVDSLLSSLSGTSSNHRSTQLSEALTHIASTNTAVGGTHMPNIPHNSLVSGLTRVVNQIETIRADLPEPISTHFQNEDRKLSASIERYQALTQGQSARQPQTEDKTTVLAAARDVINQYHAFIQHGGSQQDLSIANQDRSDTDAGQNNLFEDTNKRIAQMQRVLDSNHLQFLLTDTPGYKVTSYLRNALELVSQYYHSNGPAKASLADPVDAFFVRKLGADRYKAYRRAQAIPSYCQQLIKDCEVAIDAIQSDNATLREFEALLPSQQAAADDLDRNIVLSSRTCRRMAIASDRRQQLPLPHSVGSVSSRSSESVVSNW